jgi:hypothetical protein
MNSSVFVDDIYEARRTERKHRTSTSMPSLNQPSRTQQLRRHLHRRMATGNDHVFRRRPSSRAFRRLRLQQLDFLLQLCLPNDQPRGHSTTSLESTHHPGFELDPIKDRICGYGGRRGHEST